MKKSALRKTALAQRKELSEAALADLNTKLLAQFALLDFSSVKTIHLFLPIAEKKEPDTFLFIDWLGLRHPEIKIIVPKADFDTALMTHHEYSGKGDLEKNLYDILEPQQSVLHTGYLDLVLVPLLAFDRRGYRVGYGKGFYDRFLTGIKTQKIGLSFFGPSDEIEDVDEHDVRLDLCITPEHTYAFHKQI
jgi:5-formyltetrahydrofolate cyclo-ligase